MWRAAAVPAVVLLLMACDTGGQTATSRVTPASDQALTQRAAVLQAQGWLSLGVFPTEPGTGACNIPQGGDYLTAGQTVRGICSTAAMALSRQEWLVTLAETWDARDFGLPGATGERSHTWNFLAVRGQVIATLLSQSGAIPPQYGI